MRITHDMPTRVTKHHKRIGETKLMRCGLTATITEYYHRHDITVKVSDGSVLYKRKRIGEGIFRRKPKRIPT